MGTNESRLGWTKAGHPNLQANLQVKLASTCDDVLAGVSNPGLDTWVRLGETLETFDEFGEIGSILDLDGDLDDRGDGELHNFHVVGSLGGGEGTALEQELINTNETDNVAGGAVFERFDIATHHEDGALNGLDKQVILLSGNVVGTLDTDLGTSTDGTREDTSEGVETSLIGCGHHLGDVQDQRSLWVTVTDTNGGLVVHGTLVEGLDTVALSGGGRGKVDDNHLQEGVPGGQELPHDDLQEGLTLEFLLVSGKLDIELLEHTKHGLLLEVHDGIEDLEDGIQDEGVEGTIEGLAVVGGPLGGPLLGGRVEVVVAPKLAHHLLLVDTELLGVTGSELTEGEGPSVETGAEGDGTLLGVDLDITKSDVVIGGDNDVDVLDGTTESLVQLLGLVLKLKQGAVDLVDDYDGLDTLRESLSEHSLGLDADALDTVDDNQSTISDTESGGNLRRKVDVSRRVDQVDQELVT
jgi:hypothetical protein